MDWLSRLLYDHKIPIGRWGKAFFDFLTDRFDWFFDGLSTIITTVLEAMIARKL